MRIFKVILVAILSSAIVVSTCGMITFITYLTPPPRYSQEYWQYFAIFSVANICTIILLARVLRRMVAAATAIAIGALLNLFLYVLPRSFDIRTAAEIVGDVIILMISMTVAYVYAQKGRKATEEAPTRAVAKTGTAARTTFWSSLDPASRVAIITSLISALAAIITAIIGLLPKAF